MEAVLKTQEQLQALFLQKMETFQMELQQTPSSKKTSSLAEEFKTFREYVMLAVKSLQTQISLLARDMDNLQMRARRKMLLIHGVPEEKGEDTAVSIIRVVHQKLKISEFNATNISSCHRMGRSPGSDRPRPILLKVSNLVLRQKIWFAKKSLKGSGVTLSEYLTKSRHDVFMTARERFGVNNCWTRDGFIMILGSNNARHRITNHKELEKVIQDLSPGSTASPLLHAKGKKPGAAAAPVVVKKPIAKKKIASKQ